MAEPADANPPVFGRVDSEGRLVHADPQLAALQQEAGSSVGDRLMLPQVAAIVRLARKLDIAVTRRATVAGAQSDVDFWVTATPDGDDVALSIDRWSYGPPAPPRLEAIAGGLGLRPAAQASWSADERLRLTQLSPDLAALLSLAPGEGIGQPLSKIFRLEEDENGELPILAAAANRGDFEGQPARPRNGDEPLLLLSGTAIRTDGRFDGYCGHAARADTEASALAEQRREAVETALDDALRSPLGKIIRSAVRIAQRSDGPLRSDYAEYASDIAGAARHLMDVMTSMGGEAGGERKVVDLRLLADESAGLLSSAADAKRVTIKSDAGKPLMAEGDRSSVIQIIVNLIGNAVRHSPDGGQVSVSARRSGGFAEVHVRDSGPGVDPADQERIFERFEKASGALGNTGLGLAISRRLARSMGGDIAVESRPGEGACFTLRLPAAD